MAFSTIQLFLMQRQFSKMKKIFWQKDTNLMYCFWTLCLKNESCVNRMLTICEKERILCIYANK